MTRSGIKPGLKIGILGGGQLARLLVLQAHRLGLDSHVLSQQDDDPAAQVTKNWHQGDTNNLKDLTEFCKNMDLVTFESEFIPAQVLKNLDKNFSKKLFPEAGLLKLLQDRLSQKNLLLENKIPTSPFVILNSADDLKDAFDLFKTGVVVKTRLGGYDGKGTFLLRSRKDVDQFLKKTNISNHNFIAEKLIPFRREVALQVARRPSGQILFLPLVEIHQVDNRLDWLAGPTRHPQLSALQRKISAFLKKINYVGLIAFELFDEKGQLIVNEIAPRVHNSGHYSTDALNLDQFSLHLLAGLDQEFTKLEFNSKYFAMTNLLGAGSAEVHLTGPITGQLHWYGKTKNTLGRKLGHITYLGTSPAPLARKALAERKRMKL